MSDDAPIPRSALRAYRESTTIDPSTARRITDAVRGRGTPRRWGAVVVLAAAAAGVLAVWFTRGPAEAPAQLPIPHVALQMDGQGEVGGTQRAPVITWDAGILHVAVTPERGVTLGVITPEATVEVVGTAFTVSRTNEATQVIVEEGTVQFTCAGGAPAPLTAGAVEICLSPDPARLLLRAAALYQDRAPPADRLATTTAALRRVTPDSPLRPELLAHHIRALADAGDLRAAVAAAEEALAIGDRTRRSELLSFVARTRYSLDGCAATDALEEAARELPPGPERVLLASCLVARDPARAAELLAGAEAWTTGEWRETADRIRASVERR